MAAMDTGLRSLLRRAAVAISLSAICAAALGCTGAEATPGDGIPDRNWNRTRANGLREEDWYAHPRVPDTPPPTGFGDDD